MINRRIAILTTMLLVTLWGCGRQPESAVTESEQTLPVEEQEAQTEESAGVEEDIVKEYDHNLVCDRWADSGSFKMYTSDEDYYDFYYDYSVPQIVDDTEDAREINYLIGCLFEDMHNMMQKAAKDGQITAEEFDSTEWMQTNYECHWNGSMVSVVIYSTSYYDEWTRYNVYNYDFAEGVQLSNEDLFAISGISREEFVDGLRRAAVYELDKQMQQFYQFDMPMEGDDILCANVMDENVQRMYGDYLKVRARTIYEDNIDEDAQIYLDEQGELKVVTHLFNMGQYGDSNVELTPRAWEDNGVKVYEGDLLTVLSKEDGIYLTIYRDDWSDAMHDEYPTFEFARDYRINGLYKNYIDARISWVGNGKQPYILLLSDDGMVSYVDVWAGIVSEYFCAVEPLWGLEGLKSFREDENNRVIAVNASQQSVDVEDALYNMLYGRYDDFEMDMLYLGDVSRYAATVERRESGQDVTYEELIGYTDDDYHMFVRESYVAEDYSGGSQLGRLTFNGMTEKGMVYTFALEGEEGEIRGTMALNVYHFWDEMYSDIVYVADETWLGGADIFESKGERVALSSSFG